MIINGLYSKNFDRNLLDSLYRPMEFIKGVRMKLEEPSDHLRGQVHLPKTQRAHIRKARRIALLYGNYQRFLFDLEERGGDCKDIMNVMDDLHGCHPEGVFFEEPPKGNGYYCERYGVCPWCRFRAVKKLTDKLIPLLPQAKSLAYITLAAPVKFLPSDDISSGNVEKKIDDAHEQYTAMIKILCKTKKLFFADRVITLPNWRSSPSQTGQISPPSFNIETTIIGLMDEVKDLPLPEDCISPARQPKMPFFGVGKGTWSILKPTQKSLQGIVAQTMGFSPALVNIKLNLEEYRLALALQSKFKAVGHGAAR